MGARNSKAELFEPTLHAASRQTSQEHQAPTQNDILTPFFEAMQNEKENKDMEESTRSETSFLCATAAPSENNSEEISLPNSSMNNTTTVATPYEDIPFRLHAGIRTQQETSDFSAISEQIKQSKPVHHRYNYDFMLERGVIRESDNNQSLINNL